jgi:hypothetical protein
MEFTENNLWLKDYYISRVQASIRKNLEGSVKIDTQDAFINKPNQKLMSSGVKYDPNDPEGKCFQNSASPALMKIVGTTPEDKIRNREETEERVQEVYVVDILNNRNNNYIKIVEAEKYYNSQNVTKAYEIIKSLMDDDMYFLNAIPLYTAI